MVTMSHEEAVQEVRFFLESGLSLNCIEHVQGIVEHFGETSHEVFQEAAESIQVLIAEGIIESAAQADSLSA